MSYFEKNSKLSTPFKTTSSTTKQSTTTAPSLTTCSDPSFLYPEGSVVHDCTSDTFAQDSSCKFHCDEDYHSSNPDKVKTQIDCKCKSTGCSWKKRVEFSCQGPCRHPTSLFTKTNYYFKILKDYSTVPINIATDSVLVLISAKARTKTNDWTMAIRFKNSLENVEVFCELIV